MRDVNDFPRGIGCTPLYFAFGYGQYEAAAVLLELKADIQNSTLSGPLITHLVAGGSTLKEHTSLKLLSLMLAHGCDVHRISHYRPFINPTVANWRMLAGSSMLFCAAHEGKVAVVQLLLSHHANPLQKCTPAGLYEGQTPLSVAIDHGHQQIVALLEEAAFSRAQAESLP